MFPESLELIPFFSHYLHNFDIFIIILTQFGSNIGLSNLERLDFYYICVLTHLFCFEMRFHIIRQKISDSPENQSYH